VCDWKKEKTKADDSAPPGGGGDDGDDDGYCEYRQHQLISRTIVPINLVNSNAMSTWQFNQFVKMFNADVEKHNLECPDYPVRPLPFI
jgi:hypothetical protein